MTGTTLLVNKRLIIILIVVASGIVIAGILLGIYFGTSVFSNKTTTKVDTTTPITDTSTTAVTSKSTNLTLPIYSVIKMFTGTTFSTTQITTYSSTSLARVSDVKCSPITNYCYLADYSVSKVVVFGYNNLTYVKSTNVTDCVTMHINQDDLYISGQYSSQLFKFDVNLNWKTTYLNPSTGRYYYMGFNNYTQRLYVCDNAHGNIDVFDGNLTVVKSINVVNCASVATLGENIFYVGRTDGQIFIYQNDQYVTSFRPCIDTNWVHSLIIDSSSGVDYMFCSCFGDKMIYLYTLNGVSATLQANLSIAGYPMGLTIDPKGQFWVSVASSPNRVDVYSLL